MSMCGPGSTKEKTEYLRKFLKDSISKYGIKTVNDAGCGDLYWITIDALDIDYCGYDDLVRTDAKARLKPGWKLEHCDLVTDCMRKCDLVVCKDVFRHHNENEIGQILRRIQKCSRFLLADYDSIHKVETQTQHKALKDGEYYAICGNSVDLRRYLGVPIESVKSNERIEKRYGIWNLNALSD